MRAGPLDRRIVIEHYTNARNAEGAANKEWTTFAEVWARKEDISGEELFAADKEDGEVNTRWTIRHLVGLKVEMRINYNDQYYDILSINEIGRRDGWLIVSKIKIA